MQAAAVLVYIFCGIFSSSFIVNFVVIVLLLTLDFWTVSSAVCLPIRSDGAMSPTAPYSADQECLWPIIGGSEVVE